MSKKYTRGNKINSLNDIDKIEYNCEKMKLNIPDPVNGELQIVGSTALPVIDLKGNVYQPLHDKCVKITLELMTGVQVIQKEYSVLIEGKYKNQGSNPPPRVIPELAEWYGLEGTTHVNDETCVVVKDERFKVAAQMLINDVKEIGINLKTKNKNVKSLINFEYDDQNNYNKEGYGIVIENNTITIYAENYTGAFYATRTLHQMLKTSCNYKVNNGYIRDYPKYSIRGFMLDVGRKFVKLDYIYYLMKTMSYYKMNDFQIHLNDNAIFLDDYMNITDVIKNAYTGFRLESDIEGNDSTLTAKDGYYTKKEFKNLIEDSRKYGVTIVPEFDTPGHALSFVKVRPELMYKGKVVNGKGEMERAAMLDLDHEETVSFIQSMYNEYLDGKNPVIGYVPIHIGSDEYYGETEVYRRYVDEMLRFIRDDKKRIPRIWGSLTSKTGKTPVTSKNIQMNVWNTDWANPEMMLEQGFNIINIDDEQTYIVPGADYYHDYLNLENLYFQYQPNRFNNGTVINESHPQLLGGAFGLWNDQIDTVENGITSYDMFDRIFSALPILAQKNWGTELSRSFEAFQALSLKTMYAPSTNPRFKIRSKTNTILHYNFLEGLADYSGNDYHIKKTNNILLKNGAQFNGNNSFFELPLSLIGPVAHLEVEFELTDTKQIQILMETDNYGTIYAVDEEGFIGYKYENNRYAFNHKLEANKKINLKIITTLHKTRLFIDDKEVSLTDDTNKPYNTFILPLQRIGSLQNSLNGKIIKVILKK
ncbi:Beta-hexosaminidase [Paraliobacillus sp. PM-2]|uniref:family 20 glycosylhydrolase n=1 Tax=Paraliobacillus sp. PM-2 TaxID=1462524 RepID=UPI00061C2C45|nr:family 20 glycosylhydrolase [Paraliobacillus sp. PM-2]CQR47227.1 Beta-hexosaminidase [Paraliobacillus sp. PM-2]